MLHCTWQITHGEVDVRIACDGTKVYQGNEIDTAAFDLAVSEPGDYLITVQGKQAAGRIEICREER